jgi:hypothetical protein
MTFNDAKLNSGKFGGLGDHKANILKKVLSEGAVKVYSDPSGAVERTDISLGSGKVVITKDFEKVARLSKYKKIDIYSNEDTLLDTIDIINENSMIHTYIFYYRRSPLGRGYGDIGSFIIQSLMPGTLDPRLVSGSSVDPAVIDSIKKIMAGKSV